MPAGISVDDFLKLAPDVQKAMIESDQKTRTLKMLSDILMH